MDHVPPLRAKLLLARSSNRPSTPLVFRDEPTWASDDEKAALKGRTVAAYLTLDDVARLRRKAAAHKMSVSAYVRLVVTSHLDEVA